MAKHNKAKLNEWMDGSSHSVKVVSLGCFTDDLIPSLFLQYRSQTLLTRFHPLGIYMLCGSKAYKLSYKHHTSCQNLL